MRTISGCIIRMRHDREVCEALAEVFGEDYDTEVIDPISEASGLHATFRMERMGNLDLTGWLHSFAGDLDDLRIDGSLPALGDNIRVSIELVYGPDAS